MQIRRRHRLPHQRRDLGMASAQALDEDLARGSGERLPFGVHGQGRVEAGLERMVGEQAVAEAVDRLQAKPGEDGREALRALGDVETHEERRERREVVGGPSAREVAEQLAEPARHFGGCGVREGDGDRAFGDARGDRGRQDGWPAGEGAALFELCSGDRPTGAEQPGRETRDQRARLAGAGAGLERDRPHELVDREVACILIDEPSARQRWRAHDSSGAAAGGRAFFSWKRRQAASSAGWAGSSGRGAEVPSRRARAQRSSLRRAPLSPCTQATRTSQ